MQTDTQSVDIEPYLAWENVTSENGMDRQDAATDQNGNHFVSRIQLKCGEMLNGRAKSRSVVVRISLDQREDLAR